MRRSFPPGEDVIGVKGEDVIGAKGEDVIGTTSTTTALLSIETGRTMTTLEICSTVSTYYCKIEVS